MPLLSTVELVILFLSTFLQLVCLVAPGWKVYTSGRTETYSAIFYVITCVNSKCETDSWKDYYNKTGLSGKTIRHRSGLETGPGS